jgi:hypothetical protein
MKFRAQEHYRGLAVAEDSSALECPADESPQLVKCPVLNDIEKVGIKSVIVDIAPQEPTEQ